MEWITLLLLLFPLIFILAAFGRRLSILSGIALTLTIIVFALFLMPMILPDFLPLDNQIQLPDTLPPEHFNDFITFNQSVSKHQQIIIHIYDNSTVRFIRVTPPIINRYIWEKGFGYTLVSSSEHQFYDYLNLTVNDISIGNVNQFEEQGTHYTILGEYISEETSNLLNIFPINYTQTLYLNYTLSIPASIHNVSNGTIFTLENINPVVHLEYGKQEETSPPFPLSLITMLSITVSALLAVAVFWAYQQHRNRREHDDFMRMAEQMFPRSHHRTHESAMADFHSRMTRRMRPNPYGLPSIQGDYHLEKIVEPTELHQSINSYRASGYWTKVVNTIPPGHHGIYISDWKQNEVRDKGIPQWKHPRRES